MDDTYTFADNFAGRIAVNCFVKAEARLGRKLTALERDVMLDFFFAGIRIPNTIKEEIEND